MRLANDVDMRQLADIAGVDYIRTIRCLDTDGRPYGAPVVGIKEKAWAVVHASVILQPMPEHAKGCFPSGGTNRAVYDAMQRRMNAMQSHPKRIDCISTAGDELKGCFYDEDAEKIYYAGKKPSSARVEYLYRDGDDHFLKNIAEAASVHASIVELPKVVAVPVPSRGPSPLLPMLYGGEAGAVNLRRQQELQARQLEIQERQARADGRFKAEQMGMQREAMRLAQQQRPGPLDGLRPDGMRQELNRFRGAGNPNPSWGGSGGFKLSPPKKKKGGKGFF